MATKTNSKPCQTSEMELFAQVVTGYRSELRTLPKTNFDKTKRKEPNEVHNN